MAPPSPPPHIIIRTRPFEEWEFSVSVYEGIPYELEMAGEPSLNGQTVRFVPTTAGAACDWDAQTSAGMYGADPLVGGRMVVQLAYQSSGYYLCHRTTPGVPWVAQDHVVLSRVTSDVSCGASVVRMRSYAPPPESRSSCASKYSFNASSKHSSLALES